MGKAASALTSQQRLLESLKSFIADVKRVCAEKGLVFRAAYLVGSRARGDYVEESDADVVVVVDDVGKMNRIQRMELFVEVLIPKVDLFVYTTEEWTGHDSVWITELRGEAVKIG